jgi:protein arginine N-methyltransferase 1
MIADEVRMSAHRAAMQRAVRPGSVVVDLGAGIGIMSLIACQLGARRVYAIEPNDLVEVARELAAANGFGDRIQIIQEPAERACGEIRRPWLEGATGFDMAPAERMATNQLARFRIAADEVITPARTWTSIDYRSVTSPSARGTVSWTAERGAVGHGLRVWFDATLAPGIGFSNGPDGPDTVYGAVFLPWSAPVPLAPGDDIAVALSADLLGKDYLWRWDTVVTAGAAPAGVKARFRQSSFLGAPLGAASLRRRNPENVTKLGAEGRIAAFVLEQMGNERRLGDIARDLHAQFPDRFADHAAALAEAAALASRYGA